MNKQFFALFAFPLLLLTLLGCSRSFYRQQADNEAYCIIDHKAACSDGEPGSYSIAVDPRSRMYDPHDPDCEPMPPDDPTSNKLMQCVDCKKGSKCWKCLPKTPFVENPAWLEYLPRNEDGEVVLNSQSTVEMALLQSPFYQRQLEQLYLSALDVSFERFRFDTQFFGGAGVFVTADGEERSGTGSPSTEFEVSPARLANPAPTSNRWRAERLTATGGELVVGFANSLVWQFAGPDDYTSNTILDFSIIQPLLRTAGRTRVLERLTISERSLLANVRQMERFRRTFYVSVLNGGDPGQGPSRRGGVFGGSGLEGFSGVGGGGFGQVSFGGQGFGGQGGGQGGGGFTGGAGAQQAGGYVGLLQTAQVLRNQRNNVVSLRDSVEQLQASYDAGRIDRFQVDLARQALYNAQSQLLTSEAFYQASLDNFKVSIGLPPELGVDVADPLLDRLNLLDPELEQLRREVIDGLDALRTLRVQLVGEPQPAEQGGELVLPNVPIPERRAFNAELQAVLEPEMSRLDDVLAVTGQRLAVVRQDFQMLERTLPERRAYLERLSQRDEVEYANIDSRLFDDIALDARVGQREQDFAKIEQRLQKTAVELTELAKTAPKNIEELTDLIDALTDLSGQLLELSLVQASVRLETVTFSPVELTDEQALAIAANYRRDWMNARASLVDSWRLIYFNANDLMSDLDLVFSGDIGNVGDNPFDIRGTNGRLRVGVEFDAPLTRLGERNVYRQALIEFQQARRNYYQFRDRVHQGLRNRLRQIRLNEINFELRRAAVQVAISQVDLTQLRLSEPPQPGATEQFNNTTARDLVQSLSDLLNVQNDFLSVWVNYEVQRLGLEADLGVMELAPNGLRLENGIPLEMYLEGLPYNSTDMGLEAEEFKKSRPAEIILMPEGEPAAEPIPVPMAQSTSTQQVASEGAIRLAAYEALLEEDLSFGQQNEQDAKRILPLALPPIEPNLESGPRGEQ